MDWVKVSEFVLTDVQLQLVAPLLYMCSKYHKVSEKQKAISDDVAEIKDGQEKIHVKLDKHDARINDMDKKIAITTIQLENKWEKYTGGHKKEEASKEEVGVQ